MNPVRAEARGRRAAHQMMVDRADVTRGAHPSVTTTETSVPCRIMPSTRATVETSSGGETVAVHAYDVRVPKGTDVFRNDVLTIVESRDPELVGKWLTVFEVVNDTYQITKMLVCREAR